MVAELRNKLKKFLKRGWEKFLIIEEEGKNGFWITKAKVKNRSKKIIIERRWSSADLDGLKKPIAPADKVILAMTPKRALTVESVVRLKRNAPDEAISEAELDTLVFRGLWEFLNHYRRWAVKKFKITDPELVLAGIEIREVALGSSRVFNPLGFKGATLFFRYRGTFIPRELLGFIKKLERQGREVIVVETNEVLALVPQSELDYFVNIGSRRADVSFISPQEKLHKASLPWGSDRIVERLSSLFEVEPQIAEKILERVAAGRTSEQVKRAVMAEVKDEIGNFLEILNASFKFKSRERSRPIFYFSFRLPQELLLPFFKSRYLRLVDFKRWLSEQGYGVIIVDGESELQNYGTTFALLTHLYFAPQYRFLNQLLARRARWLTAR